MQDLLSCRRGTNLHFNKNNTQYFFPNLPKGWVQHDLVGGGSFLGFFFFFWGGGDN